MDNDTEVIVINKDEMEDMMRQILEQISALRDEIDDIKARIGENVTEEPEEPVEEEEEEDVIEEEKGGVAEEGEGGSKKKRESMDVKQNEPQPAVDSGEVSGSTDAIKSEIVKVIREEIKKAIGDIVSTPKPEVDTVEVRKEDEVRKGIRAILEGKMHAREFVKNMVGGE